MKTTSKRQNTDTELDIGTAKQKMLGLDVEKYKRGTELSDKMSELSKDSLSEAENYSHSHNHKADYDHETPKTCKGHVNRTHASGDSDQNK